MFVDIIKVRIL